MRRDLFLKSLAAAAVAGSFPLAARAGAAIKMMIPANPGGGWDMTGRALGAAILDAKVADTVQYDNKGGAAGVIGLAQFVNAAKGDPNAIIMTGAVMLGGIITGKPQIGLDKATPIARITSEYNIFVVPADSPMKSMKDVVTQMQKDPGSVKWGGGSRGSTEHICASMLATKVGVDPKKVNYVAFRGGGEAVAAILGGNVTIGGGGIKPAAPHISHDVFNRRKSLGCVGFVVHGQEDAGGDLQHQHEQHQRTEEIPEIEILGSIVFGEVVTPHRHQRETLVDPGQ